jgi:biotin operon repressor
MDERITRFRKLRALLIEQGEDFASVGKKVGASRGMVWHVVHKILLTGMPIDPSAEKTWAILRELHKLGVPLNEYNPDGSHGETSIHANEERPSREVLNAQASR